MNNSILIEHYIDLHHYIDNNIVKLNYDDIILEEFMDKVKEIGEKFVQWLIGSFKKIWHLISKWFSIKKAKELQEKIKECYKEMRELKLIQNIDESHIVKEDDCKKWIDFLQLKDDELKIICEDLKKDGTNPEDNISDNVGNERSFVWNYINAKDLIKFESMAKTFNNISRCLLGTISALITLKNYRPSDEADKKNHDTLLKFFTGLANAYLVQFKYIEKWRVSGSDNLSFWDMVKSKGWSFLTGIIDHPGNLIDNITSLFKDHDIKLDDLSMMDIFKTDSRKPTLTERGKKLDQVERMYVLFKDGKFSGASVFDQINGNKTINATGSKNLELMIKELCRLMMNFNTYSKLLYDYPIFLNLILRILKDNFKKLDEEAYKKFIGKIDLGTIKIEKLNRNSLQQIMKIFKELDSTNELTKEKLQSIVTKIEEKMKKENKVSLNDDELKQYVKDFKE